MWCSISFSSRENKAPERRRWAQVLLLVYTKLWARPNGIFGSTTCKVTLTCKAIPLKDSLAIPCCFVARSKAGFALHLWKHVAVHPRPLERNESTICSIYLKLCKTHEGTGRQIRVHRSWASLLLSPHLTFLINYLSRGAIHYSPCLLECIYSSLKLISLRSN